MGLNGKMAQQNYSPQARFQLRHIVIPKRAAPPGNYGELTISRKKPPRLTLQLPLMAETDPESQGFLL
jgi:hypothetical protein